MDTMYDMQPRHKDPDHEAFASQIKVYRHCLANWPEHLHGDLAKAWQVIKDRLKQARWSKPRSNGEDDYELNMHASWFYIKEELRRAQVRAHQQHPEEDNASRGTTTS